MMEKESMDSRNLKKLRLLRICKQKKVFFNTENLSVVTNSLLYKIEILEI